MRHPPAAVHEHDQVAELARFEDHRLAAAAAVVGDHPVVRHDGEPDDLAGGRPAHTGHQRVVGVQHGGTVLRYRLDDHLFDLGQLLDGVDAAQPEMVRLRR